MSGAPLNDNGRDDEAGMDDASVASLQAALALARRRIEELESLAHEDELTGVLNRRGFEQELRRAASYGERYAVPVTLALLDLDFFKQINDAHGHAAGDAVLQATARYLSQHVRASDVVARIGGDEFALLLWHAEPEQAASKMAQLASGLASESVPYKGHRLNVEISYGFAPLLPGRPRQDAFEAADQMLYRSKGRRRAVPRSRR